MGYIYTELKQAYEFSFTLPETNTLERPLTYGYESNLINNSWREQKGKYAWKET